MPHYIKTSRVKPGQQGLVLLLVLVFLQIFALLGIAILRKNILHLKTEAMLWQRQQLRMSANSILNSVENNLRLQIPICVIPITEGAKVLQKEMPWWRSTSCAGNFKSFQYYYVIEILGKDDCTFIRMNEQISTKYVALFYRISLLVLPENMEEIAHIQPRVILQSVYLRKGLPTQNCKFIPHANEEGRKDREELT